MRRELLHETRRQFKNLLASELEGFRHVSSVSIGPGADLYAKKVAEDLSVFICLVPNVKAYRDSFMIELAWSHSDLPRGARLTSKERIEPTEDGIIRLPALWREKWGSALEPWWETGASLSVEHAENYYSAAETQRRLSVIPQLVKDAVDKIKTYALPFFKTVAAARGYSDVQL